jgi:hypothetical protein
VRRNTNIERTVNGDFPGTTIPEINRMLDEVYMETTFIRIRVPNLMAESPTMPGGRAIGDDCLLMQQFVLQMM